MDNPKCPYCGAEMVLRDWHDIFFGKGNFYECVCGAKSPIKASPDTAHAAAMQRWQEPLKPLTLDEATGSDEPCVFLEIRGKEPIWACDCVISSNFKGVHISFIGDPGRTLVAIYDYCKTWRCWSRRPTDEERASTPWALGMIEK